jgi:hypothetical protein
MMNKAVVAAVAVAQLLVAACASSGGRTSSTPSTVVQVDNQGLADMNIYIYNAGQRYRIGFAGGLRRTNLDVAASLIPGTGEIQLLADPIGSNRASVSNRIFVSPGDTVTMIIPP